MPSVVGREIFFIQKTGRGVFGLRNTALEQYFSTGGPQPLVVRGALLVGQHDFLILSKIRNLDTHFIKIKKSELYQLQNHLEITK